MLTEKKRIELRSELKDTLGFDMTSYKDLAIMDKTEKACQEKMFKLMDEIGLDMKKTCCGVACPIESVCCFEETKRLLRVKLLLEDKK